MSGCSSFQPGHSQDEPVPMESDQDSTFASNPFYFKGGTYLPGDGNQTPLTLPGISGSDYAHFTIHQDCESVYTPTFSNIKAVNYGRPVSPANMPGVSNRRNRKQKSILKAARPSVKLDTNGDVIMSDGFRDKDQVKYRRRDRGKYLQFLAYRAGMKAAKEADEVRGGGLSTTRRVQQVNFSKSGSTVRYFTRKSTPLEAAHGPECSVTLPVVDSRPDDMVMDDGLAEILCFPTRACLCY
ncbi:hypothetical protein BDW74DRAFT_180021 [Aspergillus multicolor]|uniref:uncharacterized protein n=1 Tax=Aspergillus multicolor TaxID=41759 RepID=UPI003CCDD9E1